jgi:hypothetical protein
MEGALFMDLKVILGDVHTNEIAEKIQAAIEQEYAPRTELEALESGKADVEAQLAEANTTIESLKGQDTEAVQKKADEWKEKFEALQAESVQKDADRQFDEEFKTAVENAKGLSLTSIRAELGDERVNALKESKNRAADLKAAVEGLKGEKAFLYTAEETPPPPPYAAGTGGAATAEASGGTATAPEGAGGLRESIAATLFPKT